MACDGFVVLCSVPDLEAGRKLATVLLDEKAAACVSLLPGVESHYDWEGQRQHTPELLLLIKSVSGNYERIEQLIVSHHPYECPEIIGFSASQVGSAYLAWLRG